MKILLPIQKINQGIEVVRKYWGSSHSGSLLSILTQLKFHKSSVLLVILKFAFLPKYADWFYSVKIQIWDFYYNDMKL